MSTVNLTINGKKLTVPAGTTVMQAATDSKVAIPHFCWHPGLSVAGVCRFCMVRIEGMPKLQIACNTVATEGMQVDTLSPAVKDAHKWALEFHLINHPLDCPICDQAGECGLQNYYMEVGKYTSQMEEKKVLKPKALDVGDTLVLDTERCILCSRCVRFEDEVTKTASLGIFNRGDEATIGTYPDRRIEHNYSYNLADICPVGAFTSKDFRFKCRVWFLKETKTICPGCSTGCSVTLSQNRKLQEYHRIKPRYNPEVNGHWMCDKGRFMYTHLNGDKRLLNPKILDKNEQEHTLSTTLHTQDAQKTFHGAVQSLVQEGLASSIAIVLTPQYTQEEYTAVFDYWKTRTQSKAQFFIWRDSHEDKEAFDGILYRGDKNPNTAGLAKICDAIGVKPSTVGHANMESALANYDLVIVLGPEIAENFSSFDQDVQALGALKKVVYFGNTLSPFLDKMWLRIPVTVFAEKQGTYVNFQNKEQKLTANAPFSTEIQGVDAWFTQKLL